MDASVVVESLLCCSSGGRPEIWRISTSTETPCDISTVEFYLSTIF